MTKSKLQFWSLQILIIIAIIYVGSKITFLLEPIGIFVTTLFFPIIITLFLYFLLNPIVKFLTRKKVPFFVAIILVYVGSFFLGLIMISYFISPITLQFNELYNAIPIYIRKATHFFESVIHSSEIKMIQEDYSELFETGKEKLFEFANTLPDIVTGWIYNFFGIMSKIAIILVSVPFLLFYMFKDGYKFPMAVSRFFPTSYRDEVITIMKETGETLSSYIRGQVTVALIVGTLSLIGYLIIDLPFPLVMAMLVMVTNIIPYVGPILGGAPAVIVALFDSPVKALLVILVILIAQQLEGNVISPLILGKNLDVHPATIIIILLAAGNIAGLVGMVLAVPFYAVTKVIVLNIRKIIKVRQQKKPAT
ncbi:AI-2E family transporter [Lederbergia graminis]|uniref:AI-2E family transporter n=1 Tax=Lederbergia graminis TaxID=735518 RepID=A0ABW0LQN7_9BACI